MFALSVQGTVTRSVPPVRAVVSVPIVAATGATVLFKLTGGAEAVGPTALMACTRYCALVVLLTAMLEVTVPPVAALCAAVRLIAAPRLVHVVPPLVEVCTWKLASLFDASVHARVAAVVLIR